MTLRTEIVSTLRDVSAAAWDALVDPNDPFTEHAFLWALEQSGSATAATGWAAQHVLIYDDGRLVGATPLYLKPHSYGEFIFDWHWADASHRAGIPYYPKLVTAIPFTPVTGPRLLSTSQAATDALIDGVAQVAADTGAQSIHWMFITECEQQQLITRAQLHAQPIHPRLTHQFHWLNAGYQTFDDFLKTFRHSARKATRHERRSVAQSGLHIEFKSGGEMSDEEWDVLYRLYEQTHQQHGNDPYLTREFYQIIRQAIPHRVLVPFAYRDNKPIAAALCFQKGQHLYGRYWGTFEYVDSLHFELCYYQPIELSITRGYTRFEAGAQGIHKLKRGLLPGNIYSAHWLRHPGLTNAIGHYLSQEKRAMQEEMHVLQNHIGPTRRG